jgi:hypothetical protein
MSRRGNRCDDAVMEALVSTVKSELGERFATQADAKASKTPAVTQRSIICPLRHRLTLRFP